MSVGDLSDMESEWDPCETPGVRIRLKLATARILSGKQSLSLRNLNFSGAGELLDEFQDGNQLLKPREMAGVY